jgi:hypothetical protein
MRKYILITESALDFCLLNGSFSDDFLPKPAAEIKELALGTDILGYFAANEPTNPYFALIKKTCIDELKKLSSSPDDAYRRIARVVKGLTTPPIHLPRQWSEYHHKNLLAFFASAKGTSTRRWIADINSSINGVRFDVLASNGAEVDLAMHTPTSWPEEIKDSIKLIASNRFECVQKKSTDALAEEVDLVAIGSGSVVGNLTYEQWEQEISSSQKDVLKNPIESSVRIVGPAGSGKTLALCMRAIQISRDHDVIAKGKKILIVTHSWAMTDRIDAIVTVLNGNIPSERITVFPLLSLLELHAGHIGQQRTEVIGNDSSDGRFKSIDIIKNVLETFEKVDRAGLSQWIIDGLQAGEDSRAKLELVLNLYEEISGVLSASGVAPDDPDSIRIYIKGDREDWMPPFNSVTDRGFVIAIYRVFIQQLIDRSSITTDQFVLDSIRVLETFTWRMRKETDGYDYILIDELQVFDPQERSSIELLGRSKKGVPFVTAEDPSQGVFSALSSRRGMTQNEPVYLETVHRFNKEIFDLISYIYQKFPLNTIPLKIDKSQSPGEEKPILYTVNNDVDAISKCAQVAADLYTKSVPTDRICLATLGDVDGLLAKALEDMKLPVTRLTAFDDVEQLAYSKRSIVVAPWQFVGGTQFAHVIVVAAAMTQPQSQFGKLREQISVYLSCSRAAKSLHIICSTYVPAIIWDAEQQGLLSH